MWIDRRLTSFALACLLCLAVLAADVSAQSAGEGVRTVRLALMVGVGDYNGDQDYADTDEEEAVVRAGLVDLPNAAGDADALAGLLETKFGFDVTRVRDADLAKLTAALDDFEKHVATAKKTNGNIELFVFYSGHGMQYAGENYILPSQFSLPDSSVFAQPNEVVRERLAQTAVSFSRVLRKIGNPGAVGFNLLVVDACRYDPTSGGGLSADSSGFAIVDPPDENGQTLVVLSTAPNASSYDGPSGGNSPFLTALSNGLIGKSGGQPFDALAMFNDVARNVTAATLGKQRPRVLLSNYTGIRMRAIAVTPAPVPQAAPVRAPPPTATRARDGAQFGLARANFAELPGWSRTDKRPALSAFRAWCETLARKVEGPVARSARYGGDVADWRGVCALAMQTDSNGAADFFESQFSPYVVGFVGENRTTGYYEPEILVRDRPNETMYEPLLTRPSDMVQVDMQSFAEALPEGAVAALSRVFTGRIAGGTVTAYPTRKEIYERTPPGATVIGYAHPADAYFLQVLGSGRLRFAETGAYGRANYATTNGHRWSSAMATLRQQLAGTTQATPSGTFQSGLADEQFRAWMGVNPPSAVRDALAADPSYVFFSFEALEGDFGPRGAAGVPLRPLGSIAIDPAYHPYGAPIFLSQPTGADEAVASILAIALDTGGAIRRGPLRGDLYFGTGSAAGRIAERQNATNVRWWTLLPKSAPRAARVTAG